MAKGRVFILKKTPVAKKLKKIPAKPYVRKKCPHGRRPNNCREGKCSGSSICDHDKLRASCRTCTPQNFCEPHGRRKTICIECGGVSICVHERQRAQCIDCEGSAFCIHERRKITCRECRGSAFCIHERIKYGCKDCHGSAVCVHEKIKSKCYECDGASTCIHEKQKAKCKDCKGSAFCVHEIEKYRCKDCGGAGICIHKKRRELCNDPDCDGGSMLCCVPSCDKVFCKKYRGHCMTCFMSFFPAETVFRNYKTKEGAVLCSIKAAFPDLTIVNDRRIDGGCSQRRPDIFIDLLTHVIIVEIDENAHMAYDQNCENNRIVDISEDVAHRHVVFIRFNPDKSEAGPGCWTIDANGLAVVKMKRAAEWRERLAALNKTVEFWTTTIPNNLVEIVKLFY